MAIQLEDTKLQANNHLSLLGQGKDREKGEGMKYQVKYSNEGRPESTPYWDTYELASESAEFLKFQGSKRVKIVDVSGKKIERGKI